MTCPECKRGELEHRSNQGYASRWGDSGGYYEEWWECPVPECRQKFTAEELEVLTGQGCN